MKKVRIIFAFCLLSMAFYACTEDISIDDPKNETIEDITAKSGNEENGGEGRPGG